MVDMDEASHSSDYDTAPELLDASGQFIAMFLETCPVELRHNLC